MSRERPVDSGELTIDNGRPLSTLNYQFSIARLTEQVESLSARVAEHL